MFERTGSVPRPAAPLRDHLLTTTSDDVFLSPAHSPNTNTTEPTIAHVEGTTGVIEGGSLSALTEGGLSSGLTALTSTLTETSGDQQSSAITESSSVAPTEGGLWSGVTESSLATPTAGAEVQGNERETGIATNLDQVPHTTTLRHVSHLLSMLLNE